MKKFTVIVVNFLALALFLWLVFNIQVQCWDFRNNLWAPAYLLLHGESAFNIQLLFANSNSIWFPQIIGLFFLLGLLSQYHGTNIWLFINVVLLIVMVWYLYRQVMNKSPKPLAFGALVLLVFLFPPTVRLLILGQVDVVIIISLIAGVSTIVKKKTFLGGFLFALALTKPQLCIIVFPCLFYYLLIFKRDWKVTLKLLLSICLFVIVLSIPLWLGNSNWFVDFFLNLKNNAHWDQPSAFSQLQSKFGTFGIMLWMILLLAAFAISIKCWLVYTPTQAVLWSLSLTTLTSPYLWSWDFILVLPLFIDTMIRLKNMIARAILCAFYVICFVLSIITLQLPDSSDSVLWWFPYVLLIGIAISLLIRKKYSNQGEAAY